MRASFLGGCLIRTISMKIFIDKTKVILDTGPIKLQAIMWNLLRILTYIAGTISKISAKPY